MLESIRRPGKSFFATLVAGLSALFANAPDFTTQALEAPRTQPKGSRNRIAHSNAFDRIRHGVPHGIPGAKLARKAAAGKLGLSTLK